MSAADLEAPRALRKPGDTDAVTFSWADASAGLYGLARVASGAGPGGAASASALAVALAGRDTLGAIAEAGAEPPGELTAVTEEPLERWLVRGSGELSFELTFEALTPPAEYGGRQALVKAGGMEGYEQFCRVRGKIGDRPVRGLGQRGHSWGNPDWDKIALTRTIGAWFDDATGIALATVRPAKADHHADEAHWGAALDTRAHPHGRRGPALDHHRRGRPPHPSRDRTVDRLRRRVPLPRRPARCCRARRSNSARSGSTSRSSDGTSKDAPGIGRYDILRRA